MASFLTTLAAKVVAAAPRGAAAPRPSLSSLVAAVQGVAPVPSSARRPVQREAPIVLVSCSDTKIATHGRLVAAADLYTSPLFRKSLAHARAITSEDRIRILSARYGLLRTTDKITTYDVTLQQLSERERDAWGERVQGELRSQFGAKPRDLVLLAGAEYVSALRGLTNRFRNDRLPWTIDLPFGAKKGERMSIGERLRWLNDQAYERGEAPPGAPRRAGAKSLESLTASVVAAAAPVPGGSRGPVQTAPPVPSPQVRAVTPPQPAARSLASLTAAVVAAAPARASVTKLVQAPRPAARAMTGAAAPPPVASKSLASLTAAVVTATPSAPAPASTRAAAPSVRAGTRISFLGDTAHPRSDGDVTSVDGAYFWGRLDNGQTLVKQPIALLSTPRWRVLVGAPTPSVREPRSAAPTSLAAVAAAVESVATIPSRRAPTSRKVEDVDKGSDSPPTQRAVTSATPVLSYLTGDRVRFIDGPHKGRLGSISRVGGGQFDAHRYVLLDRRGRERTDKNPFVSLIDLEPIGAPPMLASPTASAARGIVTAFREGLDNKLARSSGTADPQPPPSEALDRILHLGREAEKAGALWKSSAQRVEWSLAVRAAQKNNGDLAAFHAGHALAASDWRDRGRALLDELQRASERTPSTTPDRERHARELAELADVLTGNGYDPADAARLQAEGMGPEELRECIKMTPGTVGSLEHTYGLLQRMVPAAQREDRVVDARQLGGHELPPRDPATSPSLAPTQHPQIASLHDLVALPIGTRLRLVHSEQGEVSSRWELIAANRKELLLRVADPTNKDHGRVVRQALTKSIVVEARPQGFALLRLDRAKQPRWIEAEYVFDEVGVPLSVGTWRATLAHHEKAETAAARRARVGETLNWLEDARIKYQNASTPAEEATALRDIDDAQVLHTATSLEELDPPRLKRLLKAIGANRAYQRLHALLVDAEERGVYGVPSAQVALFQSEAAAIGTALDRLRKGRIDPTRERIRRAISMVRHARGDGTELMWATTALREALDARKTARAGHVADAMSTEQAAAAVIEHRAEALSQRLAEKAPCATEEGVLAATLGEYRTAGEIATLLGCDVAAVGAVLAQLYARHQLRKTFTKNKPERWGHDVPLWKEDWAVHRVGDRLYGDTAFLDAAKQLPSFELGHLGYGDFKLRTPKGEVTFDRSAGEDFPGQTGRSHLLEGKPEALALLFQQMHVEERLAEEATARGGPRREEKLDDNDVADAARAIPRESARGNTLASRSASTEVTTVPASVSAADEDAPGGVLIRATPDWKPPKAKGQAQGDEATLVEVLSPVEHRTAAARGDANIKAMWLAADLEAHPRPLTNEDRLTLAAYSDWGGVGIKKALAKFPPGFPVPEPRQLIHAYFTPPAVCAEIARVVRPLLPDLVATDGRVHALEPAVGIGRFPLALSGPGFETVTWHGVEFSELSYKMLHVLRPDMDLYQGPFEGWVAAHGANFVGRLKLVISNPPYGQRSSATTDDPDRSYRYKRADHYFLRRGLDLLGAGGLGVYIIPSGFLTGKTEEAVKFRAEVLRRHHLSAAFRLPNEVFSLANVVTDILFFRARGGILAEVDEADKFVLEGRYYEEFPAHILGTVVPNEPGKLGWHASAEGYIVTGEFTALPPVLEERAMCSACLHTPDPDTAPPPIAARGTTAKATAAEQIIDDDERMATVSSLGHRVESFLASVANPDLEPVGWEELRDDLTQWATVHGSPAQDQAVLALAKAERGPLGKGPPGGAGWLLKAFLGKSSTLIASLDEKPRWTPRFLGNPNDPLQVGEHLYRSRKTLRIDELPGKDPSALFAVGWCEDSTASAWTERLDVRGHLLPPDEYLFGELWPRFDRAQARAALGDAQAAAQAARLIEIIKPATFDEIEVTPQDGFVPIEMLAAWLTTMNQRDPVELVREKGLVHVANVAYEDHDHSLTSLSTDALLILGWVNHDYALFHPGSSGVKAEAIDEARLALAKEWTQLFRAWLEADPGRQRSIEHHYQRARQGYRAHGYGAAPLKLARWNPAIVLNPHQIAGARRLDANRGGGLGFDVGVGKTFTILAALALARQAGRARRAVIVVPQPIAFQWVANLAKSLPDFRVVVIGINKKTIAHGLRKGTETSETDSPEERSRKWARFQGGEFDVAILTYDALPRTQMDNVSTLRFIDGVTAIEREVEIRRRNAVKQRKGAQTRYDEAKEKLEKKLSKVAAKREALEATRRSGWSVDKKTSELHALLAEVHKKQIELEKKHRPALTERQDAVLMESVGAWLAEMIELPAGWKHDPDILWNTIGVDWMAFDEGHNGKNLHMPASREGGSVPKFMGNEGEGSKRAWHWFFRCCDVQSRGGEVIVATATPASNSPVEFYNLVKLMDKEAWGRIGIHDPEAFIDRFCLLEPQEVLNSEMETETRLACVGFKNLDELRSVIFKFWEFKTAKQAKLKLPVAKVDRVFVDMDADQEKKYEGYIVEIERALSNPREGGHKILGLLAKMAMVAMHSQLDEKFGWKEAGLVSSPHSPKFDAVAQKILAQRGCGHIVFADYIAAHAWIRDVLIEAGIPAGRIGILNAVVAPNAADRQRIARDFNGDAQAGIASKYDVLIANAIGEEGVDLQDKTCAIHHLDIGWTPKKTEQRNGRGVRQGNTLANINIFYYIANRSQDGTRLDMVRGKQNWISSLLEGEDKDTNNPAAQSTLSRKELLVLISRDPEKTRLRLEAAEAERETERRVKVAKSAADTLRAAANRFERARTERDATIAAEYLSVAKQKLASLAKVPPDIWPWAGWAMAAEHHPMLVPKEGGPVYEGLRVAMPRVLDRSVIEYAEFGRIDGITLGTRVAGAAHWEAIVLDQVVQLHLEPQMRVAEGSGPSWPTNDQAGVDKALEEQWLPRFRQGATSADAWKDLGWMRAPDGFVEEQWSRWGDAIVRAMAPAAAWASNLQVPAIRSGQLVLGLTPTPSSVLPPTVAGWQRFLELAPRSGEKFGTLEDAGLWWFGRRIPRNLLVAGVAPLSAAA
jgi:SNF2-related domain/N-6 DNA Methylase/Helicase conserved C-terminal domain